MKDWRIADYEATMLGRINKQTALHADHLESVDARTVKSLVRKDLLVSTPDPTLDYCCRVTPAGRAVLKFLTWGLTVPQAKFLQSANSPGGAWSHYSGRIQMAEQMVKAGLLAHSLDLRYKLTDKGREALADWEAVTT